MHFLAKAPLHSPKTTIFCNGLTSDQHCTGVEVVMQVLGFENEEPISEGPVSHSKPHNRNLQ